jgi:predicted CoA-binding protein
VIEPTDDEIRSLLVTARRIAVVGLSTDESRASYGVSAYMQREGYEILPVNPKHVGKTILGQPVVAKVTDLEGPIDIVNIFRRPVDVPRPVDEAIAASAGAIWMQLGIRNDEAAQKAIDAGLIVVMDRCISVAHRLLFSPYALAKAHRESDESSFQKT